MVPLSIEVIPCSARIVLASDSASNDSSFWFHGDLCDLRKLQKTEQRPFGLTSIYPLVSMDLENQPFLDDFLIKTGEFQYPCLPDGISTPKTDSFWSHRCGSSSHSNVLVVAVVVGDASVHRQISRWPNAATQEHHILFWCIEKVTQRGYPKVLPEGCTKAWIKASEEMSEIETQTTMFRSSLKLNRPCMSGRFCKISEDVSSMWMEKLKCRAWKTSDNYEFSIDFHLDWLHMDTFISFPLFFGLE